jgi:excisionase family DNA binding protein
MAEIVGGEWLTVEEEAELAKLSDWTIYRACELGELRHARIWGRRSIRISRGALDQWMRGFERPSASGTAAGSVPTTQR